MNIKQFKYVLVLANEKSFGKAADALNISQPSLSQYIRKIEKQLGVELFDRTGGAVRLTDAGQVYIEIGRKILNLEHEMCQAFTDLSDSKIGSIIVGTSPYRSAGMMPEAIKKFREVYPGMQVVVEEMTTQDLLDAAAHGQFDFCLTLLPIDTRVFECEKIMEEEMVLAVPASFPSLQAESMEDRKYPAIDVKQIHAHPFIMITEQQVMQQELEHLCADYKVKLQRIAVVKSLEAQIAMVRAGLGMAFVPCGIERFCSAGEVRFYSFQQPLPRREVVLAWRKETKQSQVCRAFSEIMKSIAW